jgi:hypothetical protein
MRPLPEALAAYDLALVHEPQSASTHWNRALSWLQAGDFANGLGVIDNRSAYISLLHSAVPM